MPRGASPKREREYNELKNRFQKEHRYPGRAEEVAARIVNKQRSRYGETREEKTKDKEGKSPDRGLPIDDYQHLTAPQVTKRLGRLSPPQLKRIRSYELGHKHRKGILTAIERMSG
jgi:hypothetical protein